MYLNLADILAHLALRVKPCSSVVNGFTIVIHHNAGRTLHLQPPFSLPTQKGKKVGLLVSLN